MHDFDYDAMQKKRIARGAAHMKRGSKSKKCTLPSDYLTAAQKRRLNGPVSTYKLDEPMNWESFKAMPEDLQKKYILNLQETYQANNDMLGKMFGVTGVSVCRMRHALGIKAMGQSKMTHDEVAVRDAKWDAFCNGVVGGKPGEPKKIENNEVEEPHDEIDDFVGISDPEVEEPVKTPEQIEIKEMGPVEEPVEESVEESVKTPEKEKSVDFLMTEKLNVTFVSDSGDLETVFQLLKQLGSHAGKCRIHIEIEAI